MRDLLRYYTHKAYVPDVFHKQFSNDFPQSVEANPLNHVPQNFEENSYMDYAKRTALVALPLLSLDKRFGSALSISTNGVRSVSYLCLSFTSIRNGDAYLKTGYELFQLSLSVTALAAACFEFTAGLFVITSVDILTNLKNITEELLQGNYYKASEETLQLTSSALYLTMLVTGSLEATLAFFVFQAILSLYQAQNDFADERYIEAAGKALMGAARIYQSNEQLNKIKRRNALLEIAYLAELINSIKKGREIDDLYEHPLVSVADAASKKEAVLDDGNGNEVSFGAHFFGYGKDAVKGMNIKATKKQGCVELEFKLNHVHRESLNKTILKLQALPKEEVNDALKLFSSRAEGLEVKYSKVIQDKKNFYESIFEIKAEGLGSVIVGSSKELPTLYDRVRVRLDQNSTLYDFHEILSFLQIENALKESAKEDIERLKIGHLYRVFYPQSATFFERSEVSFNSSLEEYKEEILKITPKMKQTMSKYLDKMQLEEILPGKMRFHVKGLARELEKIGLKGLTSSITGVWGSLDINKDVSERLVSIMKLGMLSNETRLASNIGKNGLSNSADYYNGSSDSIFTQAVTENTTTSWDFSYWGSARLLFSPEILESGTYQYHSDTFGSRVLDPGGTNAYHYGKYDKRPGILQFAKAEAKQTHHGNEIMLKERIDPKYISAVVLDSSYLKEEVHANFKRAGLVQTDALGKETINGKAVDDFLLVGPNIPTDLT
ncbi:MAG: hypothetical protein S4CHLAM37_12790 [Chlamydiia bacterium]|nr:hypothetical protein [Chlamydiia bacterium]